MSMAIRLDRLLSNLGYCSRKQVGSLIREGHITAVDGRELRFDSKVVHSEILFQGESLDPETGIVILLNKPCGFVCTRSGVEGETIYELLPPRYAERNPALSTVGRLDKDTSGLLLISDDGDFLHKATSPSYHVPKVYEAHLASSLRAGVAELFASGTLMLEDESEPLKPAILEILSDTHVRLTITEGRYHQVRRMFAAVENHVEELCRISIGELRIGELEEGSFRLLTPDECRLIVPH